MASEGLSDQKPLFSFWDGDHDSFIVNWGFCGRSGGHVVKFARVSWPHSGDGGGVVGGGANAEGTRCSVFAGRCGAERLADTLGLSRTAAK